jgi:hypothetical protein
MRGLAFALVTTLAACSTATTVADAIDETAIETDLPSGAEADPAADPSHDPVEESPEGAHDPAVDDEGSGLLPHGSACALNEECEGGLCITADFDPAFGGGYCSGPCDPLEPGYCGPNGHCFAVDVAPPICGAACSTDADCDPPRTECVGTCVPGAFVADVEPAGVLGGHAGEIAAAVASVDPDRVLQRVRILSGDLPWDSPAGPVTIRSRAAGHPDHALAVQYLLAELESMSLLPEALPYDGGVNVVATIQGADLLAPAAVVAAHFDSTAVDTSGWEAETGPAPGANDNATGVAVALEAAHVLSSGPAGFPKHPVVIALFDGEETGMTGSSAWVAGLDAGGVACALNLDMVGDSTDAMDGRFWAQLDEATSRTAAEIAAEAMATFAPGARPAWTSYAVTWSDSASFWDAGICSVGFFAWPRPPTNHTVLDLAAGVRKDFLADVARAAVGAAAAWSSALP